VGASTSSGTSSVSTDGLRRETSRSERARCAATPDLISVWSEPITVAVAPRDALSTPTLSGPATGLAGGRIEFQVSGGASPVGSPFSYIFDWGDGLRSTVPSDQEAPSHFWRRPGEYDVTVMAAGVYPNTISSDWSEPLRVSIELRNAPDLAGHWKRVSASCKRERDRRVCKIKARLLVENAGDDEAGYSMGMVYLSNDGTASSDDRSFGRIRMKPLAPGQQRTVEFSARWSASEGEDRSHLLVALDAGDSLVEYDEENNVVQAHLWEPANQ